jgi:uncharacterized membrane protein YfcA
VPHSIVEAIVLLLAGLAAGTINTVVGSGSLITFPTLLAFGYPPLLANVTNNVGMVPGGLSGAYGYRAELRGQRHRVTVLGTASLCGGLTGAILLLVLPATAFKAIVPVLIVIALVMVIIQPKLGEWVAARQARRDNGGNGGAQSHPASFRGEDLNNGGGTVGPVLWVLVALTGVYGGYFGAAQGVLLIGLLGIAFTDGLQRVNAAKNVLAGLVNGIAAVVFIALSHVAWGAAALLAVGSMLGGQVGARVGRRLPPWGLRLVIVFVGIAALVKLLA